MTFLVLLLAAQLQTSSLPQATPANRGTIDGVVKSSDSSRGIPDVQVTLILLSTPGGPKPVPLHKVTDSEGRVSFDNLPVGTFEIAAQREGYFPLGPETDSPIVDAAKSLVSVTNGQPVARATLTLVHGGTISGQLHDARGQPVVRASVVALHAVYQAGRRTLAPLRPGKGSTFSQVTDDQGNYRLFGLPPGEYFLRADPGNGTTATVGQITFYPGTKEEARALPVVVRPGEESFGANFGVEYAPVFSVSGTVVVTVPGGQISLDGEAKRTLSTVYIALQNAPAESNIPSLANVSFSPSLDQVNFGFRIDRIAPGAYYLFPIFRVSDSRPGGINEQYSARIPVEVSDKDITGLQGVIQKYPDLRVRVTRKGETPDNAASMRSMSVYLRPQEAILAGQSGLSDDTAEILLPNVFPGRYQISTMGIPPEFYLADIRQGGLSIFKDPSVVVKSEDTPPIEVVLGTGAGRIQGIVVDSKGQQAAASVVLIPELSMRSNSLLYKRLEVPLNSGFLLRGITPGEYKIFAWESISKGIEENADFLRKYESLGRAITVNPGTNISDLVLELIPGNAR